MLPLQLQNIDFRFVLDKAKDKKPIENYWQCSTLKAAQDKWLADAEECGKKNEKFTKEKPSRLTQYAYNDPILQSHVDAGGNFGIVCGIGGVAVIDIDNMVDDLELPETFTVDTPSEGKHFYIICHDLPKKIILEKDGVHIGEIQAGGNTQIIMPGCLAKSKKTGEIKPYVVSKDVPLSEMTLEQVKDMFGKYFKGHDKGNGKQAYQDSKYELSIDKVLHLGDYKKRGVEYQGKHPVHGSTGGMNFSVNTSKNCWHCFRHDCGGGVLELIGQLEGVIGCGDKLSAEDFNLVLSIATKKYGLVNKQPATPSDLAIGVLQLIAQGKVAEATELIVRDIIDKNHIYTVRDDKTPEIWIYSEGIYIPHGKTYIHEECRRILGNAYNIMFANLVINKIMADTYTDADKFFKSEVGDNVCVLNGLLNPLTRELHDFNPKEIHFSKLNVEYKPGATCPNIQHHFREVVADESDVRVLEEIGGWFLLNTYKPEKAVMLNGHGRNGKSKTIKMWETMLGSENVSSVTLHDLDEDQYAAGDLMSKRANFAGDVSSKELEDTGMFKKITGLDPISANRKYLSRIGFFNNAKMVCACNELPNTRDTGIGFFSRWVLIDFPYRFCTAEELETFDEEERKKCKIADLDIINKLTTPEELSGLLNLSIDSLHRLLHQKSFSTSMSTEQVKIVWLRRSDSFSGFAAEYLEEDFDGTIPKQALRHAYVEYCRRNKLRPTTDKVVKEKLASLLGVYESRSRFDDDRVLVWHGLRWKDVSIKPTINSSDGGVSGQGGQGGQAISQKYPYAYSDTFTKRADHPDRSGQNCPVYKIDTSVNGDIYRLLDYIDNHPSCRLHELRELNIFNLEQVLDKLKLDGKVFEPRVGQFVLS